MALVLPCKTQRAAESVACLRLSSSWPAPYRAGLGCSSWRARACRRVSRVALGGFLLGFDVLYGTKGVCRFLEGAPLFRGFEGKPKGCSALFVFLKGNQRENHHFWGLF